MIPQAVLGSAPHRAQRRRSRRRVDRLLRRTDARSDDVEETEVGFGLVEDARGHGAVTEALNALLEHTDRAGVRIRASVRPENRASLRVLAKCGFTQLRGSTEEGELVMVRPAAGDRAEPAAHCVIRTARFKATIRTTLRSLSR